LARAGVASIELVATMVDPATFDPDRLTSLAREFGAGFHSSLFMEVGRGRCTPRHSRREPSAFARALLSYLLRAYRAGLIPAGASLDDVLGIVPRTACGAGTLILAVSAWGTVYPCHLLMSDEFGVSFDEVLSCAGAGSPWSIPGVDSLKGCSECKVRYLCAGGCRASALAAGDLAGRDPMCESYRAFLEAVVWPWDDSRGTEENLKHAWAALQ
jgi:radical SAM protein with 4Fe4S-binding SPASM domain